MANTLRIYFDALDAIIQGKQKIVPKNVLISLDAVAVEAGMQKGAIRRSRPSFKSIVDAVDAARTDQLVELNQLNELKELQRENNLPAKQDLKSKINSLRADVLKLRILYENSLSREASLFKQLYEEREEWAKLNQSLTGETIASFYRRTIKKKSYSHFDQYSGPSISHPHYLWKNLQRIAREILFTR